MISCEWLGPPAGCSICSEGGVSETSLLLDRESKTHWCSFPLMILSFRGGADEKLCAQPEDVNTDMSLIAKHASGGL